MTKVLMNLDLLEYQQVMKEDLRQVLQQNFIAGTLQSEKVEPVLARENVLPPPYILGIIPDEYNGQGDDFIGVHVLHDFGIHAMYITILDEQRNLIESGDACPFEDNPELWWFLPVVPVPTGTTVLIRATAVDCMGGIGSRWIKKTMGEDWP